MTNATASGIIAEGKTKTIYEIPNKPNEVLIWSKDDITAGDGERRDVMEGKGIYANQTTCNCFRLLTASLLRTHYINQVSDRSFRACRADMIPLELVARRIATGSYLKRRPDIAEGTRFDPLVIEFFEKDDANHDPLVIFDTVRHRILRYRANLPLATGFISEEPLASSRFKDTMPRYLSRLWELIVQTFLTLESKWKKQNVMLVDLKIECGLFQTSTHGNLDVGICDVIDNDSWRIWPDGQKKKMLDKQVYRDLPSSTPEDLRQILANYATVAAATNKFLSEN